MVLVDGATREQMNMSVPSTIVTASGIKIGSETVYPPLSKVCMFFEASVFVLHHSTTITIGYQPVIHCGVLRQSAEMVAIHGREALRTGERAIVRLRFLYFAEYILPGSMFLFREGRAKGIGKVTKVFSVQPT